jgi:hypothetical protein
MSFTDDDKPEIQADQPFGTGDDPAPKANEPNAHNPRPVNGPVEGDDDSEEVEPLDTGAEDSYAPTGAIFDEDRGRLPLQARVVLCHLLHGPFIDRAQKRDLWFNLVKYEPSVSNWLGEIFLELVIDHDLGVAFIRQVDQSLLPVKVPSLLRRRRLNFFESLLLIYLRQKLAEAELQGVPPLISASEMAEYLRVYQSKGATDHVRLENRISSAISNIHSKFYLLRRLSGVEETYEISLTLKLILTPDAINFLIEEYQNFKNRDTNLADNDSRDEATIDLGDTAMGIFDPDTPNDSDEPYDSKDSDEPDDTDDFDDVDGLEDPDEDQGSDDE